MNLSLLIKSVLIGLLLGSAFLHGHLWWIGILAGVTMCVFITKLSSAKHSLTYGLVIGLVKMLTVLSWGWYVFPVKWLGFSNIFAEIALLSSFWFLSAISLGSGYAVLSFLLWKTYQYKKKWSWVVVIFFFLFADLIGSLTLSLVMSGPGNGPNFQYANGWMGFAIAEHNILLSLAKFGGVYILSIIFGIIVAITWYLFIYKKYTWLAMGLIAIIATSGISILSYQKSDSVSVAVVHTSSSRKGIITKEIQVEQKNIYEEIIDTLAKTPTDYIIWPEDVRLARRLNIILDPIEYLKEKLGNNTIVIDSARSEENRKTTLRASIYDTNTNSYYQFDKNYLVPQSEYNSYLYKFIISILSPDSRTAKILADMNYQPGIDQRDVYLPESIPIVLFCFESIDPRGIKRLMSKRENAPFVAHVVSHTSFSREPNILWDQLDTMLRVQAVWNNIPIVQSANVASNKLYTPDGKSKTLTNDITGNKWSVSYISL